MKKLLTSLLSVLCLLLAWEGAARWVGNASLMPTLPALLGGVWALLGEPAFYIDVAVTLLRCLAGLAVAGVAAFGAGVAAARCPLVRTALQPVVVVLRSVPVISFILLALIWFSAEGLPAFIVIVTTFPLLYQSVITALEGVDPRLAEVARVFGYEEMAVLTRVQLPAARGALADGAATALGFGWRAAIMGEALAQPLRGIGSGMKEAQAFLDVPGLMAWTLVAIGTAYLLDGLLRLLARPRPMRKGLKGDARRQDFPLPATGTLEVSVAHVTKRYGDRTVLADRTFVFSNGEITCLRGVSGRGKTTLLRLVAGLERPDTGVVTLPRGARVACSFQEDRLMPWLTAGQNVAFALAHRKRDRQLAADLCAHLLADVGLGDCAGKYPHELSGGQRQRVNVARALAARSEVLLLDEPLTGLDADTKRQVAQAILRWTGEYRPLVLWATHEDIPGTRQVQV